MSRYRVSLAFSKLSDADLDEFASNVIISLTGNPSFPTPSVPIIALTPGQVGFHTALLAAANGGKLLTEAKNQKRGILVDMLRQEATYVQGIASQNLLILLSSGFDANSTNRASIQLDTPAVVGLENGLSSQLVLRMQPVANAKSYEVQTKNGGGWTPAGIFTQARRITLPGLTPGQVYSVQSRAIGGATGYSDWNGPVSHMVM
jgi:hypothetical protein